MGKQISYRKKGNVLNEQELEEIGRAARKERDRLLEERPELKEYQKEIDRLLKNAGNLENRMAVLGLMMESKLKELGEQLSYLSRTQQI